MGYVRRNFPAPLPVRVENAAGQLQCGGELHSPCLRGLGDDYGAVVLGRGIRESCSGGVWVDGAGEASEAPGGIGRQKRIRSRSPETDAINAFIPWIRPETLTRP